jgi:hypothetical protein
MTGVDDMIHACARAYDGMDAPLCAADGDAAGFRADGACFSRTDFSF